MKAKIQIKTFGGSLLFEYESENNSVKKTVEKAVAEEKSLRGADLSGADLRDAYLRGAYLRGAYLSGADLRDAYLSDAYLSGADLRGADLSGADLSGADLRDAYLRDAYLSDADLSGADLSGAYLSDADLSDADLSGADLSDAYLSDADVKRVKDDLFEVLKVLNDEVPALLESLRQGRINGSVYEGECACLVGTIAKIKSCAYDSIPGLIPNSSRPIERFFLSIRQGHTPDNSAKCKEIESWILEYMESVKAQ